MDVGDSVTADVTDVHAAGLDSMWVPPDECDTVGLGGNDTTIVLEGVTALPETF